MADEMTTTKSSAPDKAQAKAPAEDKRTPSEKIADDEERAKEYADRQAKVQGEQNKEREEHQKKIQKAVDALREAMIDAGEDPGQVDAKLYSIRQPQTNVVGNLADLQRMGAAAFKGEDSTMEASVEQNPPALPIPAKDI